MATLDPLRFEAPPVNPAAAGLFAAVNWQPSDPPRFFPGVEIRGVSYGGEDAFGVWDADWCAVPGMDTEPRKEGERPEILDPFAPMTVWAYDECDLMPQTRRDVEKRAAQILRIEEQTAVEREFARKLDEREDIKLFVKLPSWFKVDTPVGEYNPDWAIVKHDGHTLYLVRETKGTRDSFKLRTVEDDKVRCGQRHFETLGVPFAVAVSADEV